MPRDEEIIRAAIDQLLQSERGHRALQQLIPWFTEYGSGLDVQNQQAVLRLLGMAWGSRPMTTLEMIKAALRR